MRVRSAILSLVLFSLATVASAAPKPTAPAPMNPTSSNLTASRADSGQAEYIIGPEDVIEIEVVGQPDKVRARVYIDGGIQMNLIGKVEAGGKTSRQLGSVIAEKLKAGGYFANPIVNIEVISYASRYVTVLGAVGQPGLIPINRPYRMSEIMARVGGVQERAADYLIVRPEKGPEARYQIDLLATGDASQDPYVAPGDKIFIPVAEVFYISGQITQPGTYPMKSGFTLRQAIARGGGLTESGTDGGILVTRAGKKMKLDGSAKVEPGDVIVVRERLF